MGCGSSSPPVDNNDIYEGEYKNNKKHGRGVYIWENGDRYEGTFRNGLKHGTKCVMKWANGDYYCGDYTNDYQEGEGELTFNNKSQHFIGLFYKSRFRNGTLHENNGDIYCGEFDYGVKSGKGELTYHTGEKYIGEFREGVRNGRGTMLFFEDYLGRVSYEGQFKDDKMNGYGILKFIGSKYYEGGFVDDKYSGKGIYINNKEEKYDGEFSNGHFVKGTYNNPDGTVFTGSFIHYKHKDRANGYGILSRNDGTSYEGNWVKGLREGKGIQKYKNGDIFEGNFKNDERSDDFGKLTCNDGSNYEGEFLDLKKHGNGKFTWSNGNIFEGSFENDQMHGEGTITYKVDADNNVLETPETFTTIFSYGQPEAKHNLNFKLAALKLGSIVAENAVYRAEAELAKMKRMAFESENHCIICNLRDINMLILECSHLVTCEICSKNINKCPECGESISSLVKTYEI